MEEKSKSLILEWFFWRWRIDFPSALLPKCSWNCSAAVLPLSQYSSVFLLLLLLLPDSRSITTPATSPPQPLNLPPDLTSETSFLNPLLTFPPKPPPSPPLSSLLSLPLHHPSSSLHSPLTPSSPSPPSDRPLSLVTSSPPVHTSADPSNPSPSQTSVREKTV